MRILSHHMYTKDSVSQIFEDTVLNFHSESPSRSRKQYSTHGLLYTVKYSVYCTVLYAVSVMQKSDHKSPKMLASASRDLITCA
jgi:hypothetical protein